VIKTKGNRMFRTELTRPTGTTTRIVNNGIGIIQAADGSIRHLLANNTLGERITHIPTLSILADYQDPTVSVENIGKTNLNGSEAAAIALRPLPYKDLPQWAWDKMISKTTLFVDAKTGMVAKLSYLDFAENNSDSSATIDILLSDYAAVEGVMVPLTQKVFRDGRPDYVLVLKDVQFNVGLPDSDFALPKETSEAGAQ
jgi:hypothetical protein